ncbi:MAG TPA: UDP-N-acetylglucosamine 1-carboxyvinyltransferase [Patescibacteria group bacterium]|nr:UDP-N-acetylglucosamine 1-carboxyvinyltransferase [Patescibacteria group bacterium]
MDKFIITGGKPLSGEVSLCGAKNSGFKLMIAALYADEPTTLHNFSKIGDVLSTAEVIRELGGEVTFGENHVMQVTPRGLSRYNLSQKSGELSRAATYFIGPLLHHFGKAIIPNPGGCKIGRRPIDRHLEGLQALGAEIRSFPDRYEIVAKQLSGGHFTFPKNTHGGTDIMIIAAAAAKGKTILENAAQEPEVDDLIAFLNQMGAKINRVEPRTIVIEGVDKLHGTDYTVMYDRNEAVTFGCAALATKGDVFVLHAEEKDLGAFLMAVKKAGGGFEVERRGIRFFYKDPLKAVNITTRPHPGFMTDWMPLWGILMTQAEGESVIHETIFENRFAFVNELKKMGAKIELFNPVVENPEEIYVFNLEDDRPEYIHAARIVGPTPLRAMTEEITDLRAGASLILASLIARGQSELLNVEHVDRGYENLDGRLKSLGADIKRVNI